jgi:hypothetical protein
MIWLTWRQHRFEAIGAALFLVPFLALVVGLITAIQPLLAQARVACPGETCSVILQQYQDRFGFLHQILHVAFLALPILPGMFVGAPVLAREFEHRTEQVAWTQGITRNRWLFVKLGVLAVATALTAAGLGLAAGQWAAAEPASYYSDWFAFDLQVPVYAAYSFFSFALGVVAGAAIGKTVPAMAAVLVGFIGFRMVVELLVRRHYQSPLNWDVTTSLFNQGNAWLLDGQRHVDVNGNSVNDDRFAHVVSSCSNVQQPADFGTCLRENGVIVLQSYQPAERFWLFQGIETTIFIVVGLALLGLAVWLVRRHS